MEKTFKGVTFNGVPINVIRRELTKVNDSLFKMGVHIDVKTLSKDGYEWDLPKNKL